jgi:hypothetical protein
LPVVPPEERPQPLRDAAIDTTGTHGSVMGLVTAAVSAGLIGGTTGSVLLALLGLIPGVLSLVTAFLVSYKTAIEGELLVTPVSSPMLRIDGTLVSLVPATALTPPTNAPPDVS